MIAALLNQAISLAFTLVPILGLGFIAARHQRLFLALFMYLTALENTRDFAPDISLTFSGFSVYPEDLATVLFAGAALTRLGRWRVGGATRAAALVFLVLVGTGLLSWIWTFGPQQGTNSWRKEALACSVFLYVTTRPRAWTWEDLRVVIVGPAVLVVLAGMVGILLFGFGSSASKIVVNDVMETGRPVWASGSLLMLVGLWVTILTVGSWTASRMLIVLSLGTMVLLTQNRSVWVSAILSVMVWWLVPRLSPHGASVGLRAMSRTVLVFTVGGITALVGLSLAALGQSASDNGTWQWRVARWAASMSIPRSWTEWLVGSAFGPTPATTPGVFQVFAHSLYIDSIEKTGLIGLAAVVYLLTAVWRAHLVPPIGAIVCASLLGFGLSYQVPAWGWMVAGIVLSWPIIERRGRARGMQRARHDIYTNRLVGSSLIGPGP